MCNALRGRCKVHYLQVLYYMVSSAVFTGLVLYGIECSNYRSCTIWYRVHYLQVLYYLVSSAVFTSLVLFDIECSIYKSCTIWY